MIIYKNTADGFRDDVDRNQITELIEHELREYFGRNVSSSERRALTNSLGFMEKIVRRSKVNGDCGILVEYNIPATSNRIDFLISGYDKNNNKNLIIIELKQWEKAQKTDKDGIVITFLGRGEVETTHPSYQANSYKLFLKDYNENIYNGDIYPYSCAYLHNYKELKTEPLKSDLYKDLIKDTPIYFKDDYEKLENFVNKHVGKGKGMDILYEIERSKIRPSKKLVNHVISMFKGNQEFILLDKQKVAYEMALNLAKKRDKKSVIIIKGGPGTGKSVVSMNVLGRLLQKKLNVVFVAPNASFRNVMIQKLAQDNTKVRIKHLFKGSAGFLDTENNIYDVAVIDEAHRLKDGTAYQYQGDNQIEDIVKSAQTSIFFIDDYQRIRPEDIGSIKEIKRVAENNGAKYYEIELVAQFRCSGAEGYINWLDDVLHIKKTANFDGWNNDEFEFKIFDNPNDLYSTIKEKCNEGCKARLLAGYAWKWTSEKDGNKDAEINDVKIPEYDFSMPWNSRKTGTLWATDPKGINQVGCVHTSQGLEFDYVGIIVGNDLRFETQNLSYRVDWNSYKDASGKKRLKDNPEKLCMYVKNIYKILMSRGIKGCYV